MKALARLLSQLLSLPVRFYRASVSPLLPASCRYEPSCSQYALDALAQRGPFVGAWLGVRRILRCHPFGGCGYDPVPPAVVFDAHRHVSLPARAGAIVSLRVGEYRELAAAGGLPRFCSVGIHPWDIAKLGCDELANELSELAEIATDPRILAIGECGLDTACLRDFSRTEAEAVMQLQREAFLRQIEIAEHTGKPIVIHLVKSTQQFLAIRKEVAASTPWIIHGFRGKPTVLTELAATETAASPLYFSFGERFNPQSVVDVSADRMLLETDESSKSISKIARAVARERGVNTSAVEVTTNRNLLDIFPSLGQGAH